MGKIKAQLAEDQRKVVHDPPRLGFDPCGQRRIRRIGVGWHLAGEDHPTVGFNCVGEGRDRAGAVGEKMEVHDISLGALGPWVKSDPDIGGAGLELFDLWRGAFQWDDQCGFACGGKRDEVLRDAV